jgi:hypothetical protein
MKIDYIAKGDIMGNKENNNENQTEIPSKVKNIVLLIAKIILGLGFLFMVYKQRDASGDGRSAIVCFGVCD